MKINPTLNLIASRFYTSNYKSDYAGVRFSGGLSKDVFISSQSKPEILDNFLKTKGYVVRKVDHNLYAGETLADKPSSVFEYIARAGINTVIDLRSPDEEDAIEYEEKCKASGIEYTSNPLSCILDSPKSGIFDYKTNSVRDDFVDNLANLIEKTRRGNVYLGCQHGVDRTNFALVVDYIFNYDTTHNPPVIYPTNYASRNAIKNKNLDLIRKIIKKLSPEQRKKLNLPDNFEETILKCRVKDIIEANKKPFSKKMFSRIEENTGYDIRE